MGGGCPISVATSLNGSTQENYQEEGNPPGLGRWRSIGTVYSSNFHTFFYAPRQSSNRSGMTRLRYSNASSPSGVTGSMVAARSGALKVSFTSSVGMYRNTSRR